MPSQEDVLSSGNLDNPSTVASGTVNAPKEPRSKKKAAASNVIPGFGTGKVASARNGGVYKETLTADSGVNVENQRSVPGMWWTIRPDGWWVGEEETLLMGGTSSSPAKGKHFATGVVVQGWEEVESGPYLSPTLQDIRVKGDENEGTHD